MKHSKRLFAMLILILALGLGPSALAEEPNPAMPVITVQPVGGQVKTGETFTLSVEAHIPNGDEIGYRWYLNNRDYGSRAEYIVDANREGTIKIYVEVMNKTNPTHKVKSETVIVDVQPTFSRKISMGISRLFDIVYNSLPFRVLQFILYLPFLPILLPLIYLFAVIMNRTF